MRGWLTRSTEGSHVRLFVFRTTASSQSLPSLSAIAAPAPISGGEVLRRGLVFQGREALRRFLAEGRDLGITIRWRFLGETGVGSREWTIQGWKDILNREF